MKNILPKKWLWILDKLWKVAIFLFFFLGGGTSELLEVYFIQVATNTSSDVGVCLFFKKRQWGIQNWTPNICDMTRENKSMS